jgi:hypothetical protein
LGIARLGLLWWKRLGNLGLSNRVRERDLAFGWQFWAVNSNSGTGRSGSVGGEANKRWFVLWSLSYKFLGSKGEKSRSDYSV